VHPRGLTDAELAEYLLAPGRSILGMQDALKKLYDTCWYIEQTKSGRYSVQSAQESERTGQQLHQGLHQRRPRCQD
jgi:hypothetical protein